LAKEIELAYSNPNICSSYIDTSIVIDRYEREKQNLRANLTFEIDLI